MNNDPKRLSRIAKAIGVIRQSEAMQAAIANATRLQKVRDLEELNEDDAAYPLVSALFPELKVKTSARLTSEIAALETSIGRNSANAARHDHQHRGLLERQRNAVEQKADAQQLEELLAQAVGVFRTEVPARFRQVARPKTRKV